MRTAQLSLLLLQVASSVLAAPQSSASLDASAQIQSLAEQAFQQTKSDVESGNLERREGSHGTCSWNNIRIRREWGTLSKKERTAYINAVKCLQSKPAKTPSDLAPGAKSRFDDWVATHINQTTSIHYTGNFLSWHRYFTWLYEEALRDECGFKGDQPYWDWARTANTGLKSSPIFDGSETSLSGDGEFIPNQPDIVLGASQGLPPIYLKAGTGGGCVLSGPFKDMSVNLGPAALDIPGGVVVANPNGPLTYNPRCLKRDLSDSVNRDFANSTAVLSNILKPGNVYDFQMQMQGFPGSGNIGIHGGGHYSLGGDPGRDVFTSPSDPVFYLHHAMIDRVWWIWQQLDPQERQFSDQAVIGTNTFFNNPPSANTTRDDFVNYGYAAGPPLPIRDLLSTTSGPFCYVYL